MRIKNNDAYPGTFVCAFFCTFFTSQAPFDLIYTAGPYVLSTTVATRPPCLPRTSIQLLDEAMHRAEKGRGALGVLAPPSVFVPGHQAGLLVKGEENNGGQGDVFGAVSLTQKDARGQAKREQVTPPFISLHKGDAGLWANLLGSEEREECEDEGVAKVCCLFSLLLPTCSRPVLLPSLPPWKRFRSPPISAG